MANEINYHGLDSSLFTDGVTRFSSIYNFSADLGHKSETQILRWQEF